MAANKTWVGLSTPGDYSVAANWSPSGVPAATDKVHVPAGSPAITAGLNQSAIALGEFVVESGAINPVGSAAAYLQINASVFRYAGGGNSPSYIDLGGSACSPDITSTAQAAAGSHGLFLKGSAMVTLNLIDGDVGVAAIFGETATITNARVVGSSASLTLGAGVTLTNFEQLAGDNVIGCTSTTIVCWGGTLHTELAGAHASLTCNGGDVFPESSGTVAATVVNGGTVDTTRSGETRSFTTVQINGFPGGQFVFDPATVIVGALTIPSGPVRLSAQPL